MPYWSNQPTVKISQFLWNNDFGEISLAQNQLTGEAFSPSRVKKKAYRSSNLSRNKGVQPVRPTVPSAAR